MLSITHIEIIKVWGEPLQSHTASIYQQTQQKPRCANGEHTSAD